MRYLSGRLVLARNVSFDSTVVSIKTSGEDKKPSRKFLELQATFNAIRYKPQRHRVLIKALCLCGEILILT